jgi:hypothetical protein
MSLEKELADLEAECDRLLELAHSAPLNPFRLDADKHRWVEIRSYAWRDTSRRWMEACNRRDELRRRIASQPSYAKTDIEDAKMVATSEA